VDGRLASSGHSLDFLQTLGDGGAVAEVFPRLYAAVDAIVVGAGTLRWLVQAGHGRPHGEGRRGPSRTTTPSSHPSARSTRRCGG